MNGKKIFGIVVVVVGAALVFFSRHIAQEVAAGRMQIEQGQRSVDRAESLFSVSKYTQPVGKQMTGSAQRKIDAGRIEANKYETISNQLRIGGIVLVVIGALIFFFWKKKRE